MREQGLDGDEGGGPALQKAGRRSEREKRKDMPYFVSCPGRRGRGNVTVGLLRDLKVALRKEEDGALRHIMDTQP